MSGLAATAAIQESTWSQRKKRACAPSSASSLIPTTLCPQSGIDFFMSESDPEHFTSRLIINTGGPIQKKALKTLKALPQPCRVLDRAELDAWDVDWWQYVDDPEGLQFQAREPQTPYPYQKDAV